MKPRGRVRPRTLVVGPMGSRPWIETDLLVADLEALGHDVVVNGSGSNAVVPQLEPFPARVGALVNSLPVSALWLVRMFRRWRRAARTGLGAAEVTAILVWDPVLALLCRVARPRGVEVIWVVDRAEGRRFYQRLLRGALSATADRLVVADERDVPGWRARSATVVPPTAESSDGLSQHPSWVVLAGASEIDASTRDALQQRALDAPAAAVVFDARDHDNTTPALTERVRVAAGAAAVWWSADREWLAWLGGVPAEAVDPSTTPVLDQRHLQVLTRGGTLLVRDTPATAIPRGLVDAAGSSAPDGWRSLRLPVDTRPGDDRAWAAAVFAPIEVVANCPMCGRTERRPTAVTGASQRIVRCLGCGLRYASGHAPASLAPPPSASLRSVDALSPFRPVGGRLLVVGSGDATIRHAATHGWTVEAVPRVTDRTPTTGRFDAATIGAAVERTADPVALLRLLRERLLEPDGHIAIEVQNSSSVAARLARRGAPGEALTFPDAWTVRQMLQRAGFQTRSLDKRRRTLIAVGRVA